MDAAQISNQLLAASTALAGLILVFIGNAVAGYDRYSASQQHAVKSKYQRRGWLGLGGFVAALGSVLLALLYNWVAVSYIVYLSAGLLVVSLGIVCVAAFIQVRGIN